MPRQENIKQYSFNFLTASLKKFPAPESFFITLIDNYYYVGTLVGILQGAHLISGNFHIIDSKTIFLENFNYDGGAPGLTLI